MFVLKRVTLPVANEYENRSGWLFVSGRLVRLVASERNVTYNPSALIVGAYERLLPPLVPAALRLTSVVVPVLRSRTKMSG